VGVDTLIKPFAIDSLLEKVARLIDGAAALDEGQAQTAS
jgi:hypothetical protein